MKDGEECMKPVIIFALLYADSKNKLQITRFNFKITTKCEKTYIFHIV